jgi:hypothetical protein
VFCASFLRLALQEQEALPKSAGRAREDDDPVLAVSLRCSIAPRRGGTVAECFTFPPGVGGDILR